MQWSSFGKVTCFPVREDVTHHVNVATFSKRSGWRAGTASHLSDSQRLRGADATFWILQAKEGLKY
jgi:hypothetical protein